MADARPLLFSLLAGLALLGGCETVGASAPARSSSSTQPESSPAACRRDLRVLLSNDDGFGAPGISEMRRALSAAGYRVTVVAPLTNQSGKGGATTTGGRLTLKRQLSDADGDIWSVDGTPVDAVAVGLEVVLGKEPPDLVISGPNFGQNQGLTTLLTSGTVNVARFAASRAPSIPAIDISVQLSLSEAGGAKPFASTRAAFSPAADFTARLVQRLQLSCHEGRLLPRHLQLHVNYPAGPQVAPEGVEVAPLGRAAWAELTYVRAERGADAGEEALKVEYRFVDSSEFDGDTLALSKRRITVVVLENFTVPASALDSVRRRLEGL